MANAVRVVSQVTFKLWIREVATLFRTSERRIVAMGLGAILAAMAFGVVLALISSSQIPAELPIELRQTMLRTSFGSVVISTGIITTILCVTVPPRTALQTLLDMLPVSRLAGNFGQMVPLLVIGSVFSLSLAATAIAVLVKLLPNALELGGAVFVVLLTVLIIQCACVSVFWILCRFLRRYIRLPHQYSASIAAATVIVLSILSVVTDVFALKPDISTTIQPQDFMLNRIMTNLIVVPANLWNWLLAVGWSGVTAGLFALSSALHEQASAAPSISLGRGTRPRQGSLNASLWMELLIGVRNPQTIVTVLALVPFIATVRWLQSIDIFAESARSLALGIPVVPFLLVMYAVGRTLRTRWIGMHLTARETWWVAPKVIGYYALSLCIAIPALAAELALSMFQWSDIPSILSRAALGFAAALIGGTLVPYSEEQPLSVTVSGFVTAVLYMGASLFLSWMSQFVAPNALNGLTLVIALAILGLFCLVAFSQSDADVRRA